MICVAILAGVAAIVGIALLVDFFVLHPMRQRLEWLEERRTSEGNRALERVLGPSSVAERRFSAAVKIALARKGETVRSLATRFETMPMIVEGWADGTRIPTPRVMVEITQELEAMPLHGAEQKP